MKHRVGLWSISGLLFLQAGCQTPGWEQQRQREARTTTEMAALQVSLQQVEYRLADLGREQEALGQDLQQLRLEIQQQKVQTDAGLSGLTARLDAQARAQVALRQELTDDLSARMAAILQTQARAATAARAASTRGRSEVGYEHEVRAGETLSEIARAYGVTSQDILDANALRDPNVLRVGQKLFIPERSR